MRERERKTERERDREREREGGVLRNFSHQILIIIL